MQRLVVAKLVEVAEVVVPVLAVNAWRVVEPKCREPPVVVAPPLITRPVRSVPPPMVEEALELKPPKKCMRVVVDWSEPNLVKGKAKDIERVGQAVRQSLDTQRIVVEAY